MKNCEIIDYDDPEKCFARHTASGTIHMTHYHKQMTINFMEIFCNQIKLAMHVWLAFT